MLVTPGVYEESLTIKKGVTLEGAGGPSGSVVIAPPGAPSSTIEIATSDPVVLRGLTVYAPGASGIRGIGAVDVTVESSSVVAVNPPAGMSFLILVSQDRTSDPHVDRARLTLRDSFVDGTTPVVGSASQNFGVRVLGGFRAGPDGPTGTRLTERLLGDATFIRSGGFPRRFDAVDDCGPANNVLLSNAG